MQTFYSNSIVMFSGRVGRFSCLHGIVSLVSTAFADEPSLTLWRQHSIANGRTADVGLAGVSTALTAGESVWTVLQTSRSSNIQILLLSTIVSTGSTLNRDNAGERQKQDEKTESLATRVQGLCLPSACRRLQAAAQSCRALCSIPAGGIRIAAYPLLFVD